METKRFEYIDFLRSVAIIGVIAIHTLSYHLTTSIITFIWNYLHFVVVAFVFCSGYVLTARYKDSFTSFSKTILWYKKRCIRLLAPFYFYLIVHFSLLFLFPQYFSGLDLQKSPDYILKSFFLIGGANVSWLPLLFLELTLLFPIFMRAKKNFLFFYIAFSIFVTIFFTIIIFPYNYYRFVMWIPWSFIFLFSIFVAKTEQGHSSNSKINYIFFIGCLVSGLLFLILNVLGPSFHRSFTLIDHKYPPDFYYLSYAFFITCLLGFLSRFIPWNSWTKVTIRAISENSYQIFFIHYILLDFILKVSKILHFLQNPLTQFTIILLASLGISFVMKYVKLIKT